MVQSVDAWPHTRAPAGHGGMVAGSTCGAGPRTIPYTTRSCGERHTGDTAASRVPQLVRPGNLLGSGEGGPDVPRAPDTLVGGLACDLLLV
jgi:hypothetical protein